MTAVLLDRPTTPCLVYRGPLNANGYGYPRLAKGDRHGTLLHRWIVETMEGVPLEPGQKVLHRCDNPPCFRYDHLRRGTQRENLLQAVARGRHRYGHQPGETNGASVLTADQVLAVRAACAAGDRQRDVARRFGISQAQVSNIHRRTQWSHL